MVSVARIHLFDVRCSSVSFPIKLAALLRRVNFLGQQQRSYQSDFAFSIWKTSRRNGPSICHGHTSFSIRLYQRLIKKILHIRPILHRKVFVVFYCFNLAIQFFALCQGFGHRLINHRQFILRVQFQRLVECRQRIGFPA